MKLEKIRSLEPCASGTENRYHGILFCVCVVSSVPLGKHLIGYISCHPNGGAYKAMVGIIDAHRRGKHFFFRLGTILC